MWSVVEKTALAEAEVEYADIEVDTIFVKFPVLRFVESAATGRRRSIVESGDKIFKLSSVVIWTTTPWTIPGNRAICFSAKIKYGLYEVTAAPADNWAEDRRQV